MQAAYRWINTKMSLGAVSRALSCPKSSTTEMLAKPSSWLRASMNCHPSMFGITGQRSNVISRSWGCHSHRRASAGTSSSDRGIRRARRTRCNCGVVSSGAHLLRSHDVRIAGSRVTPRRMAGFATLAHGCGVDDELDESVFGDMVRASSNEMRLSARSARETSADRRGSDPQAGSRCSRDRPDLGMRSR